MQRKLNIPWKIESLNDKYLRYVVAKFGKYMHFTGLEYSNVKQKLQISTLESAREKAYILLLK